MDGKSTEDYRLEAVSDDFRRRVAEGYRKLATDEGWVVVDGTGTVEEVFARVRAAFEEHFA